MWSELKKTPVHRTLTSALIYSIKNSPSNWAVLRVVGGYKCIHSKFTFTITVNHECDEPAALTNYKVDFDEDISNEELEKLFTTAKQYADNIVANEKRNKNLKIAESISEYDLKN